MNSFKKILKKLKKKFANFLFPEINEIIITKEIINNIIRIARDAHPKEFIAFLTGKNEKGILKIDELTIQSYYANSNSTSFTTINIPTTTNVVGTVHSHPGYSNRPSTADLRTFNKHGFIHAIICLPYSYKNIQFYNKYGEKIRIRLSEN